MNYAKTASKLRGQIKKFPGELQILNDFTGLVG